MGSQAAGCGEQPRGGGPDGECCPHDGTLSQGGGRVRRLESRAARARRGRRAQRHARTARAGRGVGAGGSKNRHAPRARGGHHCFDTPRRRRVHRFDTFRRHRVHRFDTPRRHRFDEPCGPPGHSRSARRRDRREGLRRARAPVRAACPKSLAGASACRGERARRASAARGRGGCRLWYTCLRLPWCFG
jgi:hypothetical protein